jgi:hypothetical protein
MDGWYLMQINNLDLQLQQMQQSAQSRSRDLDHLAETVKTLRSSTVGGFQKTRNPQKSEVQYLSDVRSPSCRTHLIN